MSAGAYEVARSNGWLDSYTWFEELQKPNGYWDNYDNCYLAASECKNKTEFAKKHNRAYVIAKKNGWIRDYPWLNKKRQAHNKKWEFDNTLEEAKKYTSRTDFKIHASGAYKVAKENGWLDLCDWFEDTHDLRSRKLKASWNYRKGKDDLR